MPDGRGQEIEVFLVITTIATVFGALGRKPDCGCGTCRDHEGRPTVATGDVGTVCVVLLLPSSSWDKKVGSA